MKLGKERKQQQGAKDPLKEECSENKLARHGVQCSTLGNRMPKRRPLKESFGKMNYKDCEEVNEDVEETIEVQENRIKKYRTDGDRHFTEERVAEMTIDVVELRWRKRETVHVLGYSSS